MTEVHPSSLESLSSLSPEGGETFIPPRGGYQEWLSCQKSLTVYEAAVCFCNGFLDRFGRTRDQMIRVARSGKQNIIEGSEASGTSK